MIDENKLIEELENKTADWESSSVGCIAKSVVDDCIRTIKRQPKIDDWIPYDKKLPEEDKDVLVSYNDIKTGELNGVAITSYGEQRIGSFVLGKGWRAPFEYFNSHYVITAWKELPEIFKGGIVCEK